MNNTQKDELKDLRAVEAKGTLNDTQKTRLAELVKVETEERESKNA